MFAIKNEDLLDMHATLLQKRPLRRSRVYVVANVKSSGSSCQEAIIRDISPNGALLEADGPPPVGTKVELAFGRARVHGNVAWLNSTWFGIQFSRQLRDGPLAELAKQGLKVSAPRWYRRELLESRTNSVAEGS